MQYAPIALFCFNRLESLKATVSSIRKSVESANSDLYVFVDGPRESKVGEVEKVQAVRDYVRDIIGFKSMHCVYALSECGTVRVTRALIEQGLPANKLFKLA